MKNFDKTYSPKDIENKWYTFWEENNFFKPNSSERSFCIVIPPPNVTGILHMGHALGDTLQDILIRFKRMQGYSTLWQPGTDHAGISTQTIVEKHLIATQGKTRKDFSREDFLKIVWDWKEDKETLILSQLKKLGCSCDWSSLRFTLDDKSNNSIKVIFKKMFEDGLIYRGDYLVNWDPITQTAIADDEVEHEEKDSFLWYFKYPIANSDEFVTIATTRPETILGDTAIAVNPKDPRYASLIGKKAIVPFVNREILIIADDFVDKEFGSGMVKITPGHDFTDYEVGVRHNLPLINIMTPNGKINGNGKEFQGLSMLEAREAICTKMQEKNLFIKKEPYKLNIGISYRSKAIIEPYLSKQWFVKVTAFKKDLKEIVNSDTIKLIPPHWKQTYFYWIDNLRDWCISRQLWWGHRIPVWYNKKDPEKIICHIENDLPSEVKEDPTNWYQDEDVLDTWFSSALWPFSTLGWPKITDKLEKFFPTSVLITGHDILFFWVARMIMMSNYALDKIPFHKVFLHGLIFSRSYWKNEKDGSITYLKTEDKIKYDSGESMPKDISSKWEKMSKSKGNIIDPIEIINTYGCDAMRIALTSSVTHARQIDLDRRKFDEYKNFTNKLWNGSRFIFLNISDNLHLSCEDFEKGLSIQDFTIEDKWILSLLNKKILEMHHYLDNFIFDKAATLAYEFFWDDVCAYYLELTKPYLFKKTGNETQFKNKQKILTVILCNVIRLLHPIAPFITEEIFSLLKKHFMNISLQTNIDPYTKDTIEALIAPACIVSNFPSCLKKEDINDNIENQFATLKEVVRTIRNIKTEMQLPLSLDVDITFYYEKENDAIKLIKENIQIIKSLIKTSKISFSNKDIPFEKKGSIGYINDIKVFILLPEELLEKENQRLEKEKEKLQKQLEKLQTQLSNEAFLKNAPENIVKTIKANFEDTKQKIESIDKKRN
jgi:valyl-tRNA synthetase